MQIEQYTAEAICRSMGLRGFVESEWELPTLRLLLKPSFDPEVCVTLIGPPGASQVSVIVLAAMLWRQAFPCRLAEFRAEAAIPATAFDQAREDFAAAHPDRDPSDRSICLDGMG